MKNLNYDYIVKGEAGIKFLGLSFLDSGLEVPRSDLIE